MGNSGRNSEAQNAGRNVGYKDHDYKISDENEDSGGNWTRDHFSHIVAGNLSEFCPYPKTL
jgi:hypothetical protein